MSFPGGTALLLQRIIYGPSIGTAQRVDQTLPGNPSWIPEMRARFFWPRRQRHGVATERPRLIVRDERPLSTEEWPVPKEHRPRHGSMGFSPRKRSESPIPHFTSWPDSDGGSPKVQGFAGYKAGMTHAIVVDYRPTSTTSGQEVQIPVTVLEVPPMHVAAVRLYHREPEGLRTQAEVWSPKLDKELRRVFPIPKDYDAGEAWKKVDPAQIDDVR